MAGFQSLQDLIQAQQFIQGQQQYNMGGGAYGAFQEAQKQKAQQDAAQKLQNFLALQKSYPTMTPPGAVQGAANTMFGSPMQQFQGTMGMPSQQQGIMPQQSAAMNTGQSNVDLMNLLKGQGVPQDYATASAFGMNIPKVGMLNQDQYNQFSQEASNIPSYIQQAKAQGGAKTDDDAKVLTYQYLVGKYGANQGAKIKQMLWPQGTSANVEQQLLLAFTQQGK